MPAPKVSPDVPGASGVAPRDPARPASEPTEPPQAGLTDRPVAEAAGARASAAVAGARADASLGALERAVQLVSTTLQDARLANDALAAELDRVRGELGQARVAREGAEQRVAELTREVVDLRAEADAQRRALIAEQDAFLVDLLDEHERTVRGLRAERDAAREQRVARGPAPAPAREPATMPNLPAVARLPELEALERELAAARAALSRHERERSATRELLRQLRAQRDEAQASLARARAGLRSSSADEVDTPPAPRTASSQTPPPELLSAALVDAAWDAAPARPPAEEPPPGPTPQPDTVRPPRAVEPPSGEKPPRGTYSIAPAAPEEVVELPRRSPKPPR
ncbi:MAG: hypothetical protein IT376_09745 [Polyangiaceae bacterium]|nr:hypothetical protein [Polyangiaceae bacterium]